MGASRMRELGTERRCPPLVKSTIDSVRAHHETAAQWYERALVSASIAAAQEEALTDIGNATAIRVAQKQADQATAELREALLAFKAERRPPTSVNEGPAGLTVTP